MKKTNDYVYMLGRMYESTPKAVWAAIAVSFALRLNDDNVGKLVSALLEEWRALHANKIVPQHPPTAGDAKTT